MCFSRCGFQPVRWSLSMLWSDCRNLSLVFVNRHMSTVFHGLPLVTFTESGFSKAPSVQICKAFTCLEIIWQRLCVTRNIKT